MRRPLLRVEVIAAEVYPYLRALAGVGNGGYPVAELVKDAFCDKVFQTVIRDNVSLAEAPIKGKDIFEYSRNSNGAKDYMALAQEVLKLK